jgi:hypothetical protein
MDQREPKSGLGAFGRRGRKCRIGLCGLTGATSPWKSWARETRMPVGVPVFVQQERPAVPAVRSATVASDTATVPYVTPVTTSETVPVNVVGPPTGASTSAVSWSCVAPAVLMV